MPIVYATHEATIAGGTAASDVGRSSSGIADDGARLGDDLYLPTINWGPNMQDKRYQPKWKIAESSRLIFPPVIQHWVERAYPPVESAYVEGLNYENLMNSTMVDSVSQPRRLAEIRHRWMHDNNELHQARAIIQELEDETFVSEKNKAEDDLKRVTANLAEERILWGRDITENDRVLVHAQNVQEELERKAITEAQKVGSEMSAQVEKFRIDTDFVSQVQERYQALTVEVETSNAMARAKQAELEEREDQLRKLQQQCDSLVFEKNKLTQSFVTHQACLKEEESALEQSNAEVDNLTSQLAALRGDRNWLITNGLVGAFEYLRQSGSFTVLLDRLSTAAYQSGHHDGVYKGYHECQQSGRITPEFHATRGKLQGDMADALEAACNDPLPAYADLTKHVTKDDVDALRLMLEPVEDRRSYKQRLSNIFRCLDAADGLVRLQIPETEEMIRGEGVPSDDILPRVSRSCKSIIYEEPSPTESSADALSADTLIGVVPPNHVQRCGLVYKGVVVAVPARNGLMIRRWWLLWWMRKISMT
ncbi:hypothetical protein Hanom_Chr16g01466711 [Helianthus anomalus]